MSFDWIPGLFQSEQTRGLSGDGAAAVALDDSNPYYNYRLRRHRTDADLVEDPSLLWFTSTFVQERQGLGTHIAAERGEGTANFTDVLVILAEEDYDRARGAGLDAWLERAYDVLLEAFENFCRQEQFSRLYSARPLRFRFLCEGSSEMNGQNLGLSQGEFITGLLPNLYTGKTKRSQPVIGVHVNLPGVWDGYQEVGRLYNDQILFTLGNHWLDNFSHPSLQEAAIYRLQQYPDGSFVHIVNPDLADRYQVTSVQQGGTNVLTLATRQGVPLAYMVLALIEVEAVEAEPEAKAEKRPNIAMPVAPAAPKANNPEVAPPMLIDGALQPVEPKARRSKSKTIIPEAPSERLLTLQERGALLQKVHFSNFMAGYDVYISKRGELGTIVDNPAAAFQVRKKTLSLVAHIDMFVGGSRVTAGSEVTIDGDTTIEIAGERMEFRDLRSLRVDGWPYVGEIRRPASSTYLIWGGRYHIGRSRECRVVLPDEPRNDNIHWRPGIGDGATIRARTGEIPKSRFYTDSIMVASEHATLDVSGDSPDVICTARHCYIYIRRANQVIPLFPSTSGRSPQQSELMPGDELLIGNCLFQVGYTPTGDTASTPSAPAPEVRLTADALLDAVDDPDFDAIDDPDFEPEGAGQPTTPQPLQPMDTPVALDVVGMESVMGMRLGDDDDDDTPPSIDLPPIDPDDDASVPADLLESQGPPLAVPDALLVPSDDDSVATKGWDDDWESQPPLAPAVGKWDAPTALFNDEHDEDPSIKALFDDEDGLLDDDAPTEAVPKTKLASVENGPPPLPDDAHGLPEIDELPEIDDLDPMDDGFDDEDDDRVVDEEDVIAADQAARVEAVDEEDDHELDDEEPESSAAVASDELEDAVETEVVDGPRMTLAEAPAVKPAPTPPPLPPRRSTQSEAREDIQPTEIAPQPTHGKVLFTDDREARFELGRPVHIVLAGWSVRGDVTVGNHTGATLVLPENRIDEDQVFTPCDYLSFNIRGRRGHLDVLDPNEVLIDESEPTATRYDDPSAVTIDVIRRDDAGEEDFLVRLVLGEDKSLPDPRARFLALDYEDPLAAALVTRGLGVDQPRDILLGGLAMRLTWDGETVAIEDYLEGYQTADGFLPFFVQQGEQRFVTAPENGETIRLAPGDRFVVNNAIYLVRGI